MNNNLFTVVSGYWNVKGKFNFEKYKSWMSNTIIINCPYVFFGNYESISIVKEIRKDLPTHYINIEIEDFYTYKFKDTVCCMEPHVPSTEVNLIWNEKVNLVEKAKDIDPFNSDFFMWVDAGVCVYRETPPSSTPFPNQDKILTLPLDKFIFSTSNNPEFEKHKVHDNNYYHYIAGGSFILHKNFVNSFAKLYRKYIDKYLSQYNWLNTEQKILTHIYNDNPELFHCFSHGYGSIVINLV